MPVRVKPPPAETGRHHLARLRILGNRHAAERRADDRVVEIGLLELDLALGARGPARAAARIRASSESTSARALSTSACVDSCSFTSCSTRPSESFASASRTSFSRIGAPRRLGLRHWPAPAPPSTSRRRAARGSGLRVTAMPSSTFTSTTLPVIFDETVARRRAVTYPDAFRTAACVARGALGDGRGLDFDRPHARDPAPAAVAGRAQHEQADRPANSPSAAPGRSRFALDAQRRQFVFQVRHSG